MANFVELPKEPNKELNPYHDIQSEPVANNQTPIQNTVLTGIEMMPSWLELCHTLAVQNPIKIKMD